MDYTLTNLSAFCAPGAHAKSEMIGISSSVKLKLITFTPPHKNEALPIVFVPGWISVMAGWHDVLQGLTSTHKIYYLETREKKSSVIGRTDKLDVESIGLDIVALIDQLHLENGRYILFGSSLGGTAILDCTRHLIKKPKCLALVGPNAVIRVPRFGTALVRFVYPSVYNTVKPFVKWYLKHFRLDVDSDPEQHEKYCTALDNADPLKLKKALIPLSKYKVWDLLGDIALPVLLFSAARDVMHEPDNLTKMSEILTNATLVDLETNQGTHSQAVVDELHKYLSTLD